MIDIILFCICIIPFMIAILILFASPLLSLLNKPDIKTQDFRCKDWDNERWKYHSEMLQLGFIYDERTGEYIFQ